MDLVVVIRVVIRVAGGAHAVCMNGAGELGVHVAERRALVQPQQVAGSEHGAQRGDHHEGAEQRHVEARCRVVGAEDGGELAPEAGQAGQAE